MKRLLARSWPILLALSPFLVVSIFAQETPATADGQAVAQRSEADQACLACHAPDVEAGPAVHVAALASSAHRDLECATCHPTYTADGPHTEEMLADKAECRSCHAETVAAFEKSTHSNEDFAKGDHPSCVFCHGGGDPHAITAGSKWSREQKVKNCTQCHANRERMQRYKVDPDAVTSYMDSFHGKALMRFGNYNTAICTDCHAHHDVLSPMHPAAPTHANNVAKTCSQEGCHPGSQTNFGHSGANHLQLKIKHDSLLAGVLWFFRLLIFGTIAFMVLSIALDLIKVVYRTKEPPRCGRPAGVLLSLSYLSLVSAIVLFSLKSPISRWAGIAAGALVVLAFLAWLVRPRKETQQPDPRMYPRMNLNLRLQHVLLFSSVIALAATGLPLRFASSDVAIQQLNIMGGLESSRWLHRYAAVGLIAVSIWHLGYLLMRWRKAGWTLKTWKMLPNRKDLEDFVLVTKGYLGLTREEPKFDHYTFRSKIDYLAEYWGVPVMIVSGFILWFPMYFSTVLPEAAWPIAFIAHGYEATLAFLAVVCWHLYNVLFHPNVFPFNPLWITGRLSREEMEREHPLELARLDAAEKGAGEAKP